METSIDLYAEEYAEDYAEISDENPEQEAENQTEQIENEDENQESESKDEEEKRKVKPKRIIRNPRPKLDADALKSRKGLLCLEGYFKNKQFKGRGHEEEDLGTIMKTYEYWCHRLFPKFSFDDCLAKIEKLGTKKTVQVYMKRIRMDLVSDEEPDIRSDHEDEPLNDRSVTQFDDLLQETIAEEPVGLTDEQLNRIRINKEKANRRRLEKLQKDNESNLAGTSQDNGSLTVINEENRKQLSETENNTEDMLF